MEVHHYPRAVMAPDSDKLLAMSQNTSDSRLDLLVRESIQNSLDAALGSDVVVDYRFNRYDPIRLKRVFPGLESVWDRVSRLCIVISDRGTAGLTGPVRMDEVGNLENKGNYISLVKGIMDNSKTEAAGGSWGIGKTIYYRLGINFVIYYSRIRTELGGYEERLSAVWVDGGNKLFNPIDKWRGISIWGAVVKDDDGSSDVLPITDSAEISDILSIFGLYPYSNNLTGTIIIVPGICEKELLDELKFESDSDNAKAWWIQTLPVYTKMAVQKWYCMRMYGTKHPGAKLMPQVDGEPIIKLHPVFAHLQKVYNATFGGGEEFHYSEINIKPPEGSLRCAGHMAWRDFSKDELRRENSLFDNPLLLTGIAVEDLGKGTPPIAVYTRSPGMVISYRDGDFTKKISSSDEGSYRMLVFRLDPDTLYDGDGSEPFRTIEEYVRYGEKSDHFHWNDSKAYRNQTLYWSRVVQSINRNVGSSFNDALHGESGKARGKRLVLGRAVAKVLFPPGGFFVSKLQATPPARSLSGSSVKKIGSSSLEVLRTVHEDSFVLLKCELHLKKERSVTVVFGLVAPGQRSEELSELDWKRQFGTAFPFSIASVTAKSCIKGDSVQDLDYAVDDSVKTVKGHGITMSLGNSTLQISGESGSTIELEFRVTRCIDGATPLISLRGDE